MAFKGSFAQLTKLKQRLEKLPATVPQITKAAALEVGIVLEKQYTSGTDPDGKQWQSLSDATRATGRTPPPLTASGNMRSRTKVVAGVKGITTSVPSPGVFHQYGTKRMPARKIVPSGTLPRNWSRPVKEAGAIVIRSAILKK